LTSLEISSHGQSQSKTETETESETEGESVSPLQGAEHPSSVETRHLKGDWDE